MRENEGERRRLTTSPAPEKMIDANEIVSRGITNGLIEPPSCTYMHAACPDRYNTLLVLFFYSRASLSTLRTTVMGPLGETFRLLRWSGRSSIESSTMIAACFCDPSLVPLIIIPG